MAAGADGSRGSRKLVHTWWTNVWSPDRERAGGSRNLFSGPARRALTRSPGSNLNAVARLVGINHVVLEVDDLEGALDFYGRLFQLELRGRVPGMAFIDMGDQFLVLASGRTQPPDGQRHFGLVVDDLEDTRRLLEQVGVEILPGRGLDFRDPWGNHVQVVQYSEVQFSKTPGVLAGIGLDGLEKSAAALDELSRKGLS